MNIHQMIKPKLVDQKNYRIYLVLNAIGYLGSIVHIVLMPVFYWLGFPILAFLNIFSSTIWIFSWWINRHGYHSVAVTLMIFEIAVHTLICVPIIGWDAGFQYYLIGSVPFFLFNYRIKTSMLVVFTVTYCVLYSGLYGVFGNIENDYQYPLAINIFHYANIVIAYAAIGLATIYFRLSSILAEQELELLATTDPLTGICNRRKMQEVLGIQQNLAARSGHFVSLIIVDVDHFKIFNDTYGHECGDDVLREVANLMCQRLRDTDVIARWGGEEFLIMLPDTDLAGASKIAEELRFSVAAHKIMSNNLELAITMTFGVAEHAGDSIEETLAYADEQLYRGKKAGRNCVMNELIIDAPVALNFENSWSI